MYFKIPMGILLTFLLLSITGKAEKIVFPEEDLARESVLPKFDVPNSVRNRNVVVANKFELGGYLGVISDEAIFNQNHFGLLGTYHFNEVHGLNVSYGMIGSGIGSYSKSLRDADFHLDLTNTFGPKSYLLANYQLTAFYGKLSILKNVVVNTHIYGMLGLGLINYNGLSVMAIDLGIGQRFYILDNLALRFDLKFVRFSGPNPVSRSKSEIASGNLKISDYDTTNYVMTHITGGLVFLF